MKKLNKDVILINSKLFCRICGKELKICVSCLDKVFNWRNFACSYEHAIEYIKKEEERRRLE